MSDPLRENLELCKQCIKNKQYGEAFVRLRALAQPSHDFTLQHRFARTLSSIPQEALLLALIPLKIAILASSSVEHLAEILRFWLAQEGFDAEIHLAEFDTVEQTILDPSSPLYRFNPDIVWLFSSHRDILADIPVTHSPSEVDDGLKQEIQRFISRWVILQQRSSAHIISNNADIPLERIFGNLEGSLGAGRVNFLRQFNIKLSEQLMPGVTVFDLDYLSSLYGKNTWFDESYWYQSKHAFSLNAIGLVASQAARVIAAIKGQAKKCLVLDLDNTLWGGVIGDDGMEGIQLGFGAAGEAFVDFQKYLKKLKSRGIVLAVCSKNDEQNAKQPFLEHPDMQLKLEDIAVFMANWDNKAENIQRIAQDLNLGLDAFVFVDDNPVERALVRRMLPEVTVVELPQDPAQYIRAIDQQSYFETVSFSSEDTARSDMYRSNAQRKSLENSCKDINEFLRNLSMKAVAKDFDSMHLPRIAQLINKSNQFHLTTRRYTESQIKTLMEDPNVIGRYFRLKDALGDNGLISVVILKRHGSQELHIDTWVMSCRVLSRGMEEFVHNDILTIAKCLGCSRILGKYIPTAKNKLVADHYQKINYQMIEEREGFQCFELQLNGQLPLKEVFIELVEAY